jgi:O-methyltransferase involved in polyketide biosynthesis
MLLTASERWRAHGFDIELSDLRYDVDRNDVATYLDSNGWRTEATTLNQLLTGNGLPEVPPTAGNSGLADNYYCTPIRQH